MIRVWIKDSENAKAFLTSKSGALENMVTLTWVALKIRRSRHVQGCRKRLKHYNKLSGYRATRDIKYSYSYVSLQDKLKVASKTMLKNTVSISECRIAK